MCGITGFVDYQKSISEDDLINASAAIRHRGGDGFGHIYETQEKYNLGLANERLATIAPSSGLQPFTSLCGNYTITFNGTIYNYLELRATLIKYGVTFNTLSDTEVLIECYKKWGHQLFEKIDGAFAFAILDKKQRQLFLARDTMGVKPLYFYRDKNFFAFSSELKGILQFPVAKKTNTSALEKYFRYGYFFGDETIFENIWNFKKQHYSIIDLNSGNFLERKFDNSSSSPIEIPKNEEEITAKVHELLTESILRRNVADVNVGVMLSGGYDSATVAAVLQKNQAKKLRTFTLGFEDKSLDEAPYANEIAKHLNTNHSEYYIDNAGAIATLETMPQIFDEPMGDSGAIPLAFLVNQIAKEDIKVLLGAEGGDELFAGYPNYKRALLLHKFVRKTPKFLTPAVLAFAKGKRLKLQETFKSKDLLGLYSVVASLFPYTELSNLLNKDLTEISVNTIEGNSLKSILKYDQENYLANDLLLKSDRVTMFYGIDNRDTLLSTNLVNFVNQLDDSLILKNNSLKHLLKRITHQYIPTQLIDRQKKGFNIPIVKWMQTIYRPYIEAYLTPLQLDKHRFFNLVEVYKIKNRFFTNGSAADARKLWLLLQFQMWYNKHID